MRKSASKWDQKGELTLLEIWAEYMPKLRACRKNSHIHIEMSAEMAKQGFKYTPEELRTKMHNMTCRYRREKLRIGSTGGSPSEWDLYENMEILLGPFNSHHPEALVCDSEKGISLNTGADPLRLPSTSSKSLPFKSYHSEALVFDSVNDMSLNIRAKSLRAPSPSSNSPPPSPSPSMPDTPPPSTVRMSAYKKKNSMENILKSIEKNVDKIQDDIKSTMEKMLEIEEEKKEILKTFAAKEAEVQKALLEFLQKP